MSSEHDDRETDSPEREPPLASQGPDESLSDDASGPRISAHPVTDDGPELGSYDRPSSPPPRASGPPPKPRLKDSKYPPPGGDGDDDGLPPPRAKVISSPDLPPARPRSDPALLVPNLTEDEDRTEDDREDDDQDEEAPRSLNHLIPPAPAPPRRVSSPPKAAFDPILDVPPLAGESDTGSAWLPPPPELPPPPYTESNGDSAARVSPSRPPQVPPPPPPSLLGLPVLDDTDRDLDDELDEESRIKTPLVPPSKGSSAPIVVPPPPKPPQTGALPASLRPLPPPARAQREPVTPRAPMVTPALSPELEPAAFAPAFSPPFSSPSAHPAATRSMTAEGYAASGVGVAGSLERLPPKPPTPPRKDAAGAAAELPLVPPPPASKPLVLSNPPRAQVPVPPAKSDPKSALPRPPPPPAKSDPAQVILVPPPPLKHEASSAVDDASPSRNPRPSPRPPLRTSNLPDDPRLPRPPATPERLSGVASKPASGPARGAATSYPPPSSGVPQPPARVDPIAVHAIRVINISGDEPDLPPEPPSAPRPALDEHDDLEELDEYEEAVEEAHLAQAAPVVETEPELDIEVVPGEVADEDVKPPPPPKRKTAPSPPKKKEARAPKRGRRPWWEEVFSEDFSRATHHLSNRHIRREVDFIDHSLGVAEGAVVLDLACGMGQHAIELAARGYSVVGYDLSVFQLAVAGEAAQELGLKINFLQGDMREMAFQEMFDGIFCWNTSFGYFEEEKNVAVAERIFQALRPGGMFLIDVVNRDYVMQNQPSQVWFQGDACVCMDDMSVDYITSRLRVKRSIIMDDGRTKECHYSMRLYALHELGKLLHEVGFRVVEASGHPTTPGVYLGPNSPRVIILAQRP